MRWVSELWQEQTCLVKLILVVAIVLGGACLFLGVGTALLDMLWAFEGWLDSPEVEAKSQALGFQIGEYLAGHPLLALGLIACIVLIAWLSQRKKTPTE